MNNYTYCFKTKKKSKEVFDILQNIKEWWFGIYEETITGESQKINDEFSFSAGGGMHFTKQKLVELIPNKRIAWQVMECDLTFLENTREWENTHIAFDISELETETLITFTHIGLIPQIECYDSCSSAWTQYLRNLENKLN